MAKKIEHLFNFFEINDNALQFTTLEIHDGIVVL
jgi:hypothetical protein